MIVPSTISRTQLPSELALTSKVRILADLSLWYHLELIGASPECGTGELEIGCGAVEGVEGSFVALL